MKNKTQELYDQTVEEALKHVESLVKQAFAEDSRITDFVLAMGSFTFSAKRKGIIDDSNYDDYPAIKPTMEFILEWDDYLRLSGAGIWLKRDGTKLTEW